MMMTMNKLMSKTLRHWCWSVSRVPKCLADTLALVPKCLGFLQWCQKVQWTLRGKTTVSILFSSSVNIQSWVCTLYCWSGMAQWWLLVTSDRRCTLQMPVDTDATPDLLLLIQQKLRIVQYRYGSLSHCGTSAEMSWVRSVLIPKSS